MRPATFWLIISLYSTETRGEELPLNPEPLTPSPSPPPPSPPTPPPLEFLWQVQVNETTTFKFICVKGLCEECTDCKDNKGQASLSCKKKEEGLDIPPKYFPPKFETCNLMKKVDPIPPEKEGNQNSEINTPHNPPPNTNAEENNHQQVEKDRISHVEESNDQTILVPVPIGDEHNADSAYELAQFEIWNFLLMGISGVIFWWRSRVQRSLSKPEYQKV